MSILPRDPNDDVDREWDFKTLGLVLLTGSIAGLISVVVLYLLQIYR